MRLLPAKVLEMIWGEHMPATDGLIAETREADGNLHRFIPDERWQRFHDNSAWHVSTHAS
jgi:hypothetical protein